MSIQNQKNNIQKEKKETKWKTQKLQKNDANISGNGEKKTETKSASTIGSIGSVGQKKQTGRESNMETNRIIREDFPLLMSAKDLQKVGVTKTMAYQLLNREDIPVVCIGGRKFVNRDKFFQWLDSQTLASAQSEKA